VRDPKAADEILAGSAREHGELDVGGHAGGEKAVDDLVDCSVPSDHDEQLRAALDGAGREAAELGGALREKRVAR